MASLAALVRDTTTLDRDQVSHLNRLTSGRAVIPDESVERFGFSGGQAGFDAMVEVSRA